MKQRFPLTLRISIATSASILAILLAVIGIGGTEQSRSFRQLMLSDNEQIVAARVAEFDRTLAMFISSLKALSLSPDLLSKDKTAVSEFVMRTAEILPREAVALLFAWPSGEGVTSLGQPTNVADREYFKDIMSGSSEIELSSPVISKSLGVPIVVVSCPVKDRQGRVAGMIGMMVELSKLSEITTAIKVGKSGYGWLIDSSGLVIAHQDQQAIMSMNVLEADAKNGYKGLSAFGKRMLAEDAGVGEWQKADGSRWVTYFGTPRTSRGWKLGINQPIEEISAQVNALMMLLVSIAAGGLLIAIVAAFFLSRSIIKPISNAAKGFRDLAQGEADLTKGIELDRNDEVGDLVRDFNGFLEKLRDIVSKLKTAQSDLSRIGEGLGGSVEGTASAIDAISSDVEAVKERGLTQAASVEESSSAVNQITRNIANLDALIAGQAASITEASAAIEQMVGNNASVSASVEKIASEFAALLTASESGKATLDQAAERAAQISAQSRSLAEMNDAIASIASNTNLLAMNAAIEAAHAGEAGKGFSVVADEIRRLSETASEQSKNIGAELDGILSSIDDIVSASSESSAAFGTVADKIAATDSLVKEVNQAMSEQAEGSKQILEALREMNEVTAQVKTGSAEMSAGNQAVLEEMARLRDVSFEVKARVDAIASGSGAIATNVGQVEKMAEGTRETISRMEESIGRFVV